jgi:hypothetical protein
MKKLMALVVGALFFPIAAYAVPIIQFAQTSGSNTITATANGSDTATTISGSNIAVDVTQCLCGILGSEFFNINATSVDAAVPVGTGALQHYSGTFSITSAAGGGGTNLLSGSFTDAALGVGQALTLAIGAPPDTLNLTSSVIPASQLVNPSALTFGLTNVSPPITIAGSTINSFTATVAGNASSNAVPASEPAGLAIIGLGIILLGAIKYRGKPSQEMVA